MEDGGLDDERGEELNTILSIYPELVIDTEDPYRATLELLVAPSKALPVTFEEDIQRLSYLPPLQLTINLPATYPNDSAPSIDLSTALQWLPSNIQEKLISEAQSLWEEYGGGMILFSYISSLQEQAETCFGLEELTLPSEMQQDLVAYNNKTKRELFDKETFDCEVCLEPKKGSVCYRMERCSHVFCVACLQDYYNNCITEGDVNNVKCMSTECGKSGGSKRKKDRLLSPKELLQIPLDRATVERFAKIKRKKKIESDPTIIYCPRTWCQGAMRTDKYPKITDVSQMDESDEEVEEDTEEHIGAVDQDAAKKRSIGRQGMERLAICEDCNIAFCIVCFASWHGDLVRCEPRDLNQLTEEDQASLNFILKSTSPCPYCSVPCQKSYGCNRKLSTALSLSSRTIADNTTDMTCAHCETHFCYLCSAWLNPDHPYAHYNDPKFQNCFQRLMDGAEGEEIVVFGGPRGAEQAAEFWEQEAMRIQLQLNEEDDTR